MKKNEGLITAQMYFMWGNKPGENNQVFPREIVELIMHYLQYPQYKEWENTAYELDEFLKLDSMEFITDSPAWTANPSLARGIDWVEGDDGFPEPNLDDTDFYRDSARFYRDCARFYRESIQPLIQFLATTPLVNDMGQSVLMLVVVNKFSNVLNAMLAVDGINVNLRTNDGYTALMCAAMSRKIEIVKPLLAVKDIDVNAKTKDGTTALLLASSTRNADVVKAMLAIKGIDLGKPRGSEETTHWALSPEINSFFWERHNEQVNERQEEENQKKCTIM